MSAFHSRLKTPEEVELERKRHELAQVQGQLAEREEFFAAFRADIRRFEQRYEEMLGVRIAQLEDLEWQLDGLLGGDRSGDGEASEPVEDEDEFARFQHYTDLLDDEEEPEPDAPRQSLKHLYREVAKAIHPDLATDDEDRLRRQELMVTANQAYEMGDRSVLEDILGDRDLGPETNGTPDVATELVRVIRQIARVQQNIHAVERQIQELKGTDIHAFKVRVEEAHADGMDLLAEMAAALDLNIAKARKRLAALRGDPDLDDDPHTLLETRLIRFPKDRSYGTLYERVSGSVDYRDW
ncbi:MAG TPA: J domain-containing protein, partial [Desulfuromonadaceae bacterium]